MRGPAGAGPSPAAAAAARYGADRKGPDKLRPKLLVEADICRSTRTGASQGILLDRWLPQHDGGENTRDDPGLRVREAAVARSIRNREVSVSDSRIAFLPSMKQRSAM